MNEGLEQLSTYFKALHAELDATKNKAQAAQAAYLREARVSKDPKGVKRYKLEAERAAAAAEKVARRWEAIANSREFKEFISR